MNKKKRLTAGIIGLIGFMIISSYAYNRLTNKYTAQPSKSKVTPNQAIKQIESEITKEKILAPDFTVYDKDGKSVKLSDYKGTPVVLNFWASWCPPCRNEMPYFNKASITYKDKKLAILMVNLTDGERETKETAEQYIKKSQYDALHVLFDTAGDAMKAYQLTGIPATIMINKDGYIVDYYVGGVEEEVLTDGIDKLIDDNKK